jgi:hypothetical protein
MTSLREVGYITQTLWVPENVHMHIVIIGGRLKEIMIMVRP